MSNDSIWTSIETRGGHRLGSDVSCDVCVVGGGIAGLATAYRLARAGRSVVLLEGKDEIASGETAYTTAHLSDALDDRFSQLQRRRGVEVSQIAFQSHQAAIDWIETVAIEESIACDFSRLDGYLMLGIDGEKIIDDEESAARRAGAELTRLSEPVVRSLAPGPWLRFSRQGQVHPLKFLVGLAAAYRRHGGRLYVGTMVEGVETGDRNRVKVRGGQTVEAAHVVVATNTPLLGGVRVNMRTHAYTTYAIAMEASADALPPGLYWDTNEPYHYVRHGPTAAGGAADVIIVGGEDHKTGQVSDQAERWGRLEEWTRKRIPGVTKLVARWSGQVFETLDGLGLIGRDPERSGNVYIATGDSGMGMTHGVIAGILLTDLITGRPNPWTDAYAPTRLPINAAGDLIAENANMAAQFTDWVTGSDVPNIDEVKPGQGAVIRQKLSKIAVYRDQQGQVHACSAVCPHMGCIVRWNDAEKTWDCPCHGSRFNPHGDLLHGPAVSSLSRVSLPLAVANA